MPGNSCRTGKFSSDDFAARARVRPRCRRAGAADQQGLLQASSSATDLAIQGGGFFVVNSAAAGASNNGTFTFTRARSFTIGANGNLKNSAGLFLQGQALTPAQAQAIQNGNFDQLTATSLTSMGRPTG